MILMPHSTKAWFTAIVLLLITCSSALLVACGAGTASNFSTKTSVTPPPPINSVPSSSPNANKMGINIYAPLDYSLDYLYADAIRTARDFKAGTDANSTTLASVDADGWPQSDFAFYVWGSGSKRNGTYTLIFTGQATVTTNPGVGLTTTYDAASNTTTGTFNYTNTGSAAFAMSFSNTKRTSGSATGTGVTSIKLMRPLTPGDTQSYASTTMFTNPIKAVISKFSVIRFMDFFATNSNQQTTWSERPRPAWPSFNRGGTSTITGKKYGWQGIGGPLEHAILLANETGNDAWINIPALVDDAYVTNVANMIAYGSDGINPYTSTQANPVYPPLNSNLHAYIEYSNELWNSGGAFTQSVDNCQMASDELVNSGGASPLNWDGAWHGNAYAGPTSASWSSTVTTGWDWSMCFRRPVKRIVEISNIFRGVFGDAEMMTRIRPVLPTQLTASGRTLAEGTRMLLGYYNHMAGSFTTTPAQPVAHPPNYYIYSSGGSGYYDPQNTAVASADALFADPGMLPAGYLGGWDGKTPLGIRPSVQADVKYTTAMGVKRIAYEGGPNLEAGVNVIYNGDTSAAGKALALSTVITPAVNDPRMKTAMIDMHNEWSANGGDLFVYFISTGDAQWGFTPDVTNLGTFKFAAIDALNVVDHAPITFGTAVPGSVNGTAADSCSTSATACSGNNILTANVLTKQIWANYIFRSDASAAWAITLTIASPATSSTVAVYVDGVQVDATKNATAGTVSFNAGTIGAGIHGVIVHAVSGSFTLSSIAVSN